tara:strand:+ start:58 stop:189 length:132 start_codon:yes stop_codon:yes gene_type:complete
MDYRVDENNNLIDEEGNIIGGVGSDPKPVVINRVDNIETEVEE